VTELGTAVVRVPARGDRLAHRGLVDRSDLLGPAAEDPAAGQQQRCVGAVVLGEVAVGQVVAEAGVLAAPVVVVAGDREDVGDVDAVDERAHLVDEQAEVGEAIGAQGDRRAAIRQPRMLAGRGLDRAAPWRREHHPPDREPLEMRVLAAQQRVEPADRASPVDRLEVVGHEQEVRHGRQAVGRVAPVAVRERAQLAGADELREAGLDRGEVLGAGGRPVAQRGGQLRGRRRVRVERGHDVDPVEQAPLVEAEHVVLRERGAGDQVADQPGVGGDPDAQGILDGADGGRRVGRGAGAADPLREQPRVARVAAVQHVLDSAERRAAAPRVADGAVGDVHLDSEVAADAGDGVDDGAGHRSPSRSGAAPSGAGVAGVAATAATSSAGGGAGSSGTSVAAGPSGVSGPSGPSRPSGRSGPPGPPAVS
jgi:hypothetical protein